MSDISRTQTNAPPQQAQEQEQEQEQKNTAIQEQPPQESQRLFAQKLKQKSTQKTKEQPSKTSSETAGDTRPNLSRPSLSSVMQQAGQKAAGATARESQKPTQSLAEGTTGRLPDEREKRGTTSSAKADAVLQGLQPQIAQAQAQPAAALQGATQTNAPTQGADRLFQEFQTVAERVMHTSQNLQQGGSVRLQLGSNVLPGTSVTFAMVAGALHVTFSGNNKKSLDKLREHKDGLVSHVRKHSGVEIVVTTQDEETPEQQGRYP